MEDVIKSEIKFNHSKKFLKKSFPRKFSETFFSKNASKSKSRLHFR